MVENQFGAGSNDLHKLADFARTQARAVDAQVREVEPKIAAALDQVEARLPEPVGSFVHQARTVAEAVRDEARKRLFPEPTTEATAEAPAEPAAEAPVASADDSTDQTASPNA